MGKVVWLAGSVTGALFLSSCVTYPYQSAFSSCESEANACYRFCEEIPDEGGYIACQSHCDRDIDRCFDQAYSPYSSGYGYGSYGYSSPWYGRYGSWYPDQGYFLSFNYYDRYGYRKKRYSPRNDWDGQGGSGSRPGNDRPRDPDAVPLRPSDPDGGTRDRSRRQRYEPSDNRRRTVDPDATDPRPAPSVRRAPSSGQPAYTPPPTNAAPRPTYTPPSNATPPTPAGKRREPVERSTPDAPDRDID